jgi:3-oxoacyl-[acyl-carrier-protein] synthase III
MVLTNADLSKLVDTNDEWIAARTGAPTTQHARRMRACADGAPATGIRERRILSEGETLTQLAADAGRKARRARARVHHTRTPC